MKLSIDDIILFIRSDIIELGIGIFGDDNLLQFLKVEITVSDQEAYSAVQYNDKSKSIMITLGTNILTEWEDVVPTLLAEVLVELIKARDPNITNDEISTKASEMVDMADELGHHWVACELLALAEDYDYLAHPECYSEIKSIVEDIL